MDEITCKLVFPFGSVTEETLPTILSQYTDDFQIINFTAESQIGINKVTCAVVDIHRNIVPKLYANGIIKDVDLIADNSIKHADDGCKKSSGCGGGCGCG